MPRAGRYTLVGEVIDDTDGNVTPATVELTLTRGLFLPGRRQASAAEGYVKGAYGRTGAAQHASLA